MRAGAVGHAGGSGQHARGEGGEKKGGAHQEVAVAMALEEGQGPQHIIATMRI